MPSQPKPLWVLTWLLLIMAPVLNTLYWNIVLEAGVLPHDGDAIAIPIFAGMVFTVLISPFVLTVSWLCLRRYNPRTRFLAWRSDRPVRSIFASLVFGAAALGLAGMLAHDVRDMFGDYPGYEFLFTSLLPPAIVWSLAMRAAFIEQCGAGAV